ncbi:glycoside hydrolase family 3 N-terminal domain-containing protein [Qipengyuania sp.]|uniref:glycoside hydrolase family 3 protein n=1 Tax=Qipengyuania sp. TaxID=2004515 RepID=UPI0035C801EF
MRGFATVVAAGALLAGCASQDIAPPASTTSAVPAAARANPELWPAAKSPAAITDPATEAAITQLLARMTLAQKVGQVIQGDISSVKPADLIEYPLGSILAGGNSGPYGDERADGATWKRLVDEYRQLSLKAGAGIPILFGVDAVHGHSNVPGATIFPHNIGLGAAHDPDLIRRIGAATAAEVAGTGIEWTFAPTVAVPQDLRWGRTYEGYSSDPQLVAAYSSAMVHGLQGDLVEGSPLAANKVGASVKHFLADGGTQGGKDQGDAQMPERELIAKHALGYPAAIDAGALTVMVSFSGWNGTKHHGNSTLLTDVLKGRMGFAGLEVGDWNAHGQLPGCTVTDCAKSLAAGLDLYMAPDSWKGLFDSLVQDVRSGKIAESRLDDAVRRILRAKYKLGLMGDTLVERGDPAQLGAPAHLALAREAVAKSLVLLKNEGSVLPIKPGARVLITGPGADDMAMQAGGWTVTWQGTDTTAKDFPKGATIGRAIADAVKAAGGTAVIDPKGTASSPADVAIVIYGEHPYAEFQGDIPDLAFRANGGEDRLLESLKARGLKTVSVFLSGRPLFAGKLINASDAFVAAWLPGSQGQGVADVLVANATGTPERDFTGRLSFDWPRDARSPMEDPLFKRGYGLSYGNPASLGSVNEDPGMDLAAARADERYFIKGQVVEPWRLGLDTAVTARAIDLGAQEDARQFEWAAPGGIAIDGPAVNLHRQLDEGFALFLDMRIDTPATGPVTLAFGGAALDITAFLAKETVGDPFVGEIPIKCFADAGADLENVSTPLRITAPEGFAMTLRSARIDGTGSAYSCP